MTEFYQRRLREGRIVMAGGTHTSIHSHNWTRFSQIKVNQATLPQTLAYIDLIKYC